LIKLLVVGQTPPPFHGQAIAIENFVTGTFDNLQIHYVPMSFSATIDEVGRFSVLKILKLLSLIFRIHWRTTVSGCDYLYYPPAGPNKTPVLRDIAVLLCCRWRFRKTIFHFHAAGLSTIYDNLGPILQRFFRLAYFTPDLSIILSQHNPRDDIFLQSRRSAEIPYGIPDPACDHRRPDNPVPRILYVSMLFRSKGIETLITAVGRLREQGHNLHVDVVGAFESLEFETECRSLVRSLQIEDCFTFHGQQVDDGKWRFFACADIFCFPSYYESESFGIVLIEALAFGIPVVSTRWRGIQSAVVDEETGFLVPIKNPEVTASKIALLLENPHLRQQMGEAGRVRYEKIHTLSHWYKAMERAVSSLEASK
jgi:glycosyltransferase involved in cell wall biosynthesis